MTGASRAQPGDRPCVPYVGNFFVFKGKRCVVIKTSRQMNNRKAFAIVESRFLEAEGGTKHREPIG